MSVGVKFEMVWLFLIIVLVDVLITKYIDVCVVMLIIIFLVVLLVVFSFLMFRLGYSYLFVIDFVDSGY